MNSSHALNTWMHVAQTRRLTMLAMTQVLIKWTNMLRVQCFREWRGEVRAKASRISAVIYVTERWSTACLRSSLFAWSLVAGQRRRAGMALRRCVHSPFHRGGRSRVPSARRVAVVVVGAGGGGGRAGGWAGGGGGGGANKRPS